MATTTTSSSGGAASYAIDFNGSELQKLILDTNLTDLTFTTSNLAAGRKVRLLIDHTTNNPALSTLTAPSWMWFTFDFASSVPYANSLVEFTSWGTTDAEVSANASEAA